MKHLQRYWFTYLLVAIIAYMLYLLLSVPKPIDSHSTENENLKAENSALKDSIKEFTRRQSIDRGVITSQDSTIRATRLQADLTRRELNKTKDNALQLAKEIKELKKDADTSELARKAVELAEQVENYTFLLDDAMKQYDSVNTLYEAQKVTYEKMLADRASLLNQVQTAHNKVTSAYDGLHKDYGKVSKKLRMEKLKTKVTAVIAVAEAVLLLLKK